MTTDDFNDQYVPLGQFAITGVRHIDDGVNAISVLIPATPLMDKWFAGVDASFEVELIAVLFAKVPESQEEDSE